MDSTVSQRELFYERLDDADEGSQTENSNAVFLTRETHREYVATLERLRGEGEKPRSQREYRLKHKYYLIDVDGVKGIARRGVDTVLVAKEDLFDVIDQAHVKTGHGGRDVINRELRGSFYNVTLRSINIYLSLCQCRLEPHAKKAKRYGKKRRVVVKKSKVTTDKTPSRCQVDVIDMQSNADGEYHFIMVYQDHLTKFVCLRPLKTKREEEVAHHLLHIFSDKGAPQVLESDSDGREFANKIIERLQTMWPECKLVHGHSQSQDSVDLVTRRDIEDVLRTWQRKNQTSKWADGLWFVQYASNRRVHPAIGRSPYEAMYGRPLTVGLEGIPEEVARHVTTEEELVFAVFAENAKTFKPL